jgi:2-polyprenyl-3-methyl-5-hydroxy-6-metoxy-1,4-benzoquinol methylase
MEIIRRIYNKAKRSLNQYKKKRDLSRYGERVDINYNNINYDFLDLNERAHLNRYLFARDYIKQNSDIKLLTCGDFACGSGYGSALLAESCYQVIGVDYNRETIKKISERYKHLKNLSFICGDLLEISRDNYFDFILSFETIEHFEEYAIIDLLSKFCLSLEEGGHLILSTPYCEPQNSEPVLLGHHKTYGITPAKLTTWLENSGFIMKEFKFQSFENLTIKEKHLNPNFIIAIGIKQ